MDIRRRCMRVDDENSYLLQQQQQQHDMVDLKWILDEPVEWIL